MRQCAARLSLSENLAAQASRVKESGVPLSIFTNTVAVSRLYLLREARGQRALVGQTASDKIIFGLSNARKSLMNL